MLLEHHFAAVDPVVVVEPLVVVGAAAAVELLEIEVVGVLENRFVVLRAILARWALVKALGFVELLGFE